MFKAELSVIVSTENCTTVSFVLKNVYANFFL